MSRRVFKECNSCGHRCIARKPFPLSTPDVCITCESKPSSIARFSGDFSELPIVEEEVTDMKAQTQPKAVEKKSAKAKLSELPVTAEAVHQSAIAYQAMKTDETRVATELKKLNDFLKKHLPGFDGKAVEVNDGKILYLCEPEPSRSFDLDAAQETLSKAVFEKLEPFIKTTKRLELESAEKLIDMTAFKKFIVEKPNSASLRFKDKKEA